MVPAGEPRLRAIARQLLERGIRGAELSRLEDAWLPLLEPFPWGVTQANGLRLRGAILFGIAARLLGDPVEDAESTGALWSLADGAAHCSDPSSREFLLKEARAATRKLPRRVPRKVRAVTVLASLAAHDLGRGGRVGRVAAALVHRLRGTFPRS